MLKKYKNVFITGDLHLGDAAFDKKSEDRLISAMKSDNHDCYVFGGDTFDPWRGRTIAELIAQYRNIFQFLRSIRHDRLERRRVVFLRGNHDPHIELLRKWGFSVKKKFKYIAADGRKIKIIHGDEFDRDCYSWQFLTKKLVFLEERINRLLRVIGHDKIFRFVNLLCNVDLLRVVDNFYKRIKEQRRVDALIFGHLHVPWEGRKEKIDFFNWGGWQKDYGIKPQYIVNKQNRINIYQVE